MCIQSHNFYFYLWQARPLDTFAENAEPSQVSQARASAFARRSHRRSTLPHTDCKLLCYNFLSIDCLYLCFSLPARYTWLYCYTLICVPHVVCTTPFVLFPFYCFSFLSSYKRADFSFFLPFRSVSQIDEWHTCRVQSSVSPFLVPLECSVSNANNYTQCIKTARLNDTSPHPSRACAPRLSNCVYERAKNVRM